jgi:hypothetical protein
MLDTILVMKRIVKYSVSCCQNRGHAVVQWLRHCDTNRKVAGSIADGVTGIFHWQSFRPHYGRGIDSASNRNEYQEYFLGVALDWHPYHLHVPIVLKSGSLNLLEPSRPVMGLLFVVRTTYTEQSNLTMNAVIGAQWLYRQRNMYLPSSSVLLFILLCTFCSIIFHKICLFMLKVRTLAPNLPVFITLTVWPAAIL